MGVQRNPAGILLAVGDVQVDGGDQAAPQQFPQHIAGAHRGQLVRVAHQKELGARFNAAEQLCRQPHIDHGDLVHNDQVGLQRLAAAEVSVLLVCEQAQRAVQRRGRRVSGGFYHPPAGPPCGGRKEDLPLGPDPFVDVQDHPQGGGLAGTGAAGDDAQRAFGPHPHRFRLFFRKG